MREGTHSAPPHPHISSTHQFMLRREELSWSKRLARVVKGHIALMLGIWGMLSGGLTFYYKDVLQPQTAPVNVSVNLELKKVSPVKPPANPNGANLIAVEMQVGAVNPSTREISLLPNIWIAYGYRISKAQDQASFENRMNSTLEKHRVRPVERLTTSENAVTLAGGNLLSDNTLKPGEKVVRKLVFHVPKNSYDVIEVWTVIPTTSKANSILMSWRMEKNEMVPDARYNNKERSPLKRNAAGTFVADELELQQSGSRVALSLWE